MMKRGSWCFEAKSQSQTSYQRKSCKSICLLQNSSGRSQWVGRWGPSCLSGSGCSPAWCPCGRCCSPAGTELHQPAVSSGSGRKRGSFKVKYQDVKNNIYTRIMNCRWKIWAQLTLASFSSRQPFLSLYWRRFSAGTGLSKTRISLSSRWNQSSSATGADAPREDLFVAPSLSITATSVESTLPRLVWNTTKDQRIRGWGWGGRGAHPEFSQRAAVTVGHLPRICSTLCHVECVWWRPARHKQVWFALSGHIVGIYKNVCRNLTCKLSIFL